MTRMLALALTAALLTACGGGAQSSLAPELGRAKPQAVSRMSRGVALAEDDRHGEAVSELEAAVAADANLWEARYDLGLLLAQRGELKRAEDELGKAYELAPNAEDVALALAEVRRRRGNPRAAADVLLQFVERHPQAMSARIAAIAVLRDAGRADEAIEMAQSVLLHRPGDGQVLAELALSHLAKKETDTAQLLSDESLKAAPDSAAVQRTAGLVALERGDDALAFRHFARASELDPKETTARSNVATVLLQAGVFERAAEEFRAVLAVAPQDVAARIGLAAALRGQGTRDNPAPYREAEKILLEVLKTDPGNLAANFNLGLLYTDYLKQPAKAAPLLKQFLANAPDDHPERPLAQKRLTP